MIFWFVWGFMIQLSKSTKLPPAFEAVKMGNMDKALTLIQTPGFNINYALQPKQHSLLMIACLMGEVVLAEKLLELGANVNQEDVDGRTALIYAAPEDNLEILQLLLKL